MDIDTLKFPIGKYYKVKNITKAILEDSISSIESFPKRLQECVHSFEPEQFETPYRPNGWTVKQLIHHCADSHMNSLIRFKLSLTENSPTIKPYDQDKWAALADSTESDVSFALKMLEGIHDRWVYLLRSLSEEDLDKSFFHPESQKLISIRENICIYAWHCEHHLAHIIALKKRMSW